MPIKATSLKLDEDLWFKVKIDAMKKKITTTEYVERALRDKLSKGSKR
jgi:hypothetical protein